MSVAGQMVRQALLAALTLLPGAALADLAASFDASANRVILTGLEAGARDAVLADPDRLRLRIDGAASGRGMLLSLDAAPDALIVAPRFPLRPGHRYRVDISLADGDASTAFDLPRSAAPAPSVAGFAPSQSVIPANTLRVYIRFSEPMARGQLRQSVRLLRTDGTAVESPFLNLETELWDPSQTRATILLDPGRIKQGVGPNALAGTPLEEGESYRLTVSADMKSARGVPIGTDTDIAISVGPPERRSVAPAEWRIEPPLPGTLGPLSVAFDRVMDTAAAARLLTVEDPWGNPVSGRIQTDGGGWSLIPDTPWVSGPHTLRVHPDLEDVAGNTVSAPFDAAPGTMGTAETHVLLTVAIP